ncbi:MAG: septal ring lytic transglycosylase RlpA family protein [Cyclobacteriaceae bacterium]
MKKTHVFTVLCILILTSCKVARPVSDSRGELIESGVASWYGPGFQGKRTANGERFNTNGFTAAHRTLPFNTKLHVVNITNGKSVDVRINDRGPYAKDRVIDLSKAAAARLDMIQAGTANVQLFLLNGSASDLGMDNIKKPTYAIQVASFSDKSRAQQKANEFSDGWIKEVFVNRKKVYRVFVGKFQNTESAKIRNSALKSQGVDGFVKQVEN